MKNRFLICFFLSVISINSFAFSSIATIEGNAGKAWFRASNYGLQKEADIAALEGCRVEARKNGIGNLTKKCKISTRAKQAGYGAVVCADDGCAWSVGAETSQAAVDDAFNQCNQNYKNCQSENIQYWEDFAGFTQKSSKEISQNDCRPRTSTISCKSSCNNGDCIVIYTNGCKMRVRVNPVFNGATWTYPSPSC